MSELAAVHTERGLPRGRGSLPPAEVAQAQRERLLRAVIAAVAELGYGQVRIADIVERARVSRQSFYGQFPDKEACFLAAHADGVQIILLRFAAWAADHSDPDPRAQLSGAVASYLELAIAEPEFAHCMLIELQAIGPAGLSARIASHAQIAVLLAGWHAATRASHPSWPPVPESRYAAAVGAVHDLIFSTVAAGELAAVPALAPAAVDAVATLLELPQR